MNSAQIEVPVPHSDDTVDVHARHGNFINYSRPGRLTANPDPGPGGGGGDRVKVGLAKIPK